jgi:HEAT repeat protein
MSKVIENLLDDCRSGDPSKQAPAIMKLQDIEAYEAVPVLVELLTSPEENIRSLAAEALGLLGDDEIETVGSHLLKALSDPEALVRSSAIEALLILDYKPAIEAAKQLCRNDPEWFVRVSAIEALVDLADVGDEEILSLLNLIFNDPNEDEVMAGYAAWAIGLLGTSDLLPTLKEYLASEDSQRVKVSLLIARYRLGSQEDISHVLEILRDTDEESAGIILNDLQDLTVGQIPPALIADAPHICEVIEKVSKSFTIERNHAEQVVATLKNLSA